MPVYVDRLFEIDTRLFRNDPKFLDRSLLYLFCVGPVNTIDLEVKYNLKGFPKLGAVYRRQVHAYKKCVYKTNYSANIMQNQVSNLICIQRRIMFLLL